MDISQERLLALIEFTKQSALLRNTPRPLVSSFACCLFEERFSGLPGISHNLDEGDLWLRIDRLHETQAEPPISELLNLWCAGSKDPMQEPTLKPQVLTSELRRIGALSVFPNPVAPVPEVLYSVADAASPATDTATRSAAPQASAPSTSSASGEQATPAVVTLQAFTDREAVHEAFAVYLQTIWQPWAALEKKRRKTISLYRDLFVEKQKLDGGLADGQLELVWGAGIASWHSNNSNLQFPLLTQLVELSLDAVSMALEIRPRAAPPRLELDLYAAQDNPGVAGLEKAGKAFFREQAEPFSPFNADSFESILRTAVSFLDAQGAYWPDTAAEADRRVPKPADNLVVTDTWVLFSRPRNTGTLIADLESFEKQLQDAPPELPGALAALLTDPSASNADVPLPAFRGLSMVAGSASYGAGPVKELYFPLPYNDEQVQIIQLLDIHAGVAVQGPPGTGKTHTIANVISHYLALGKKVLVTSMKDPALAVLQEKLPEDIRPLAISLLTSEADGLRQFEFAIDKIAAQVSSIDRVAYGREIEQLDDEIDRLHSKLALTDLRIREWASKNLSALSIDGIELEPLDAAQQVVALAGAADWFDDVIGIDACYRPQFSDQEIISLREARRTLGADLAYLNSVLPALAALPAAAEIQQAHQDLAKVAQLQAREKDGAVPGLSDQAPHTLATAQAAFDTLGTLRRLGQRLQLETGDWASALLALLRRHPAHDLLALLEPLGAQLLTAKAARTAFIGRPVSLPAALALTEDNLQALHDLAEGRRPFGLGGLFGKSEEKQQLAQVRILSSAPASDEDWAHVSAYAQFMQHCSALLARWNALTGELPLPELTLEPAQIVPAAQAFERYGLASELVETEAAFAAQLNQVLTRWPHIDQARFGHARLDEVDSILSHHLTRQRLAASRSIKQRLQHALAGTDGVIGQRLHGFVENRLGQSDISTENLQLEWSQLSEELSRVTRLAPYLQTITTVSAQIEACGAPNWAKRLRHEVLTESSDRLLPDNWAQVWKVQRLHHYLESIDARAALKTLAAERRTLETGLARAYQSAVSKRTWLTLAQNATPEVRAGLEAYRNAIRKLGKGTGIRSARYRQDARVAAAVANRAIPCWIMPHYRISESLPADIGDFDLVIIDEASQSDLSALPALLRAKKILVVGDDRQVSPDGVGLEELKINNLMSRFLAKQVPIYRAQMTPDRSIYDLFKVVFAHSTVMLREHFRCVPVIIEYSKRYFYNHELKPLRLPKASERLDPPLVDVFVEDGSRDKSTNPAEARFIVDEIRRIVEDPRMLNRSIGVVSLMGTEQALRILTLAKDELGEERLSQCNLACGDARTFQGKERDIMFLSMVVSPGKVQASSAEHFRQRYNVAASRARDRMYLVRSISADDLSKADTLRAELLQHFDKPFAQNEQENSNNRSLCESPFEEEVFDFLSERGYRVLPQVPAGGYRLDLVVEGNNDARLAIECDGDRYHGPDKWDDDMRRQRILERAGWTFWRCFASTFVRHRQQVCEELLQTLTAHGIEPMDADKAPVSLHVEHRRVIAFAEETTVDWKKQPLVNVRDPALALPERLIPE